MSNIASSVSEVKGKVALVTGAASGIGRAVAELLHARGARVVAEDIDPAVKHLERDGLITVGSGKYAARSRGEDSRRRFQGPGLSRDREALQGQQLRANGSVAFGKLIQSDLKHWSALIRAAGVKID
jgi:NAD(P)-dependent dehydrogenase (short-subunit alcohol dehydrogenase family)